MDPFIFVLQQFICPLLLLAQIVLPVYALSYRLSFLMMANRTEWPVFFKAAAKSKYFAPGVVLCVLSIVLELAWLLPLAFCLFKTYWTGRRRPLVSAPERLPLQVDESRRPRFCEHCSILQDNREYHCEQLGRCLPYFDHWCVWWRGAVWKENAKAYLLFLTFLTVHLAFTAIVTAWALSTERFRSPFYIGWALLVSGFFFFFAVYLALSFWMGLALCNVLSSDHNEQVIYLRISDTGNEDDVIVWEVKDLATNPWNLGIKGNFKFVMGPWRSWWMFWSPTPLTLCEEYPTNLPARPPISLPELPSQRRRDGHSTGFEEEYELDTVSRRHSSTT